MIRSYLGKIFYIGLFVSFCVLPVASPGGEHETYKEVGGVAIHIGIMPADMIRIRQSGEHSGYNMHGGIPKGAHRDHLVVALFEGDTGKRITNARVTATMAEIGLAGRTKELDVMEINGTVTWGNYFYLPNHEAYRVIVQIQRPGVSGAIEASFMHRHPRR